MCSKTKLRAVAAWAHAQQHSQSGTACVILGLMCWLLLLLLGVAC